METNYVNGNTLIGEIVKTYPERSKYGAKKEKK